MTTHDNNLIRQTTSTCPRCRKMIEAQLVEVDGKVYLEKKCPEHGDFRLVVARHPWYYRGLTGYYFDVMPTAMKQKRYYIYLSNKCDMTCPVCLLSPNQNKFPDISLPRFEETIREHKGARFYLYGAEPTLRTDLAQWIKLLKRYGNFVNMHTNGINISDLDYLKKLRDSGLDYVSIQFDGFDDKIYQVMRGRRLLDLKLKAFENLRRLDMQTGINVTVARGINEDQMERIIDFAVRNPFIRDVSFATLSLVGNADPAFTSNAGFMPDELIDTIEAQTAGKISRKNIYLFQKLYYAILSAFNVRRCYNFHHLVLVRDKKMGYITLDSLFALENFEKQLEIYRKLTKKTRIAAKSFLLFSLFSSFVKKDLFKKLQYVPVNMFFPGNIMNVKIPQKILLVSFGTVCDYYKFDSGISKYCGQGFCFEDNGKTVMTDSISDLTLFYGEGICK